MTIKFNEEQLNRVILGMFYEVHPRAVYSIAFSEKIERVPDDIELDDTALQFFIDAQVSELAGAKRIAKRMGDTETADKLDAMYFAIKAYADTQECLIYARKVMRENPSRDKFPTYIA